MDRLRATGSDELGKVAAMLRIALVLIVPLVLIGCAGNEPSSNDSKIKTAAEPRPSLTLRVLVVNEPELAEAINRLRGEWAERATGQMTATEATWADVAFATTIDADVVVFPSRYLGDLCTRGLLRPVRSNVLQSDELKLDDFFPLVRQELIKYGGQVMALPLGVYLQPANRLGVFPELSLLSRAAPRAVSRERIGVLFDSETMKPRITEAAFLEALHELVASASRPIEEASSDQSEGDKRVPLIGYDDRLAAVATSSRNAASAFKLLEWLARPDTSSQFARASGGAMPARQSLASSAKWYPDVLTADERSKRAKLLIDELTSEHFLMIPRIPGVDDYIAALAEAVALAVTETVTPQAALEKTAQRWEEITNAYGRDAQRAAYLKHLGIEP